MQLLNRILSTVLSLSLLSAVSPAQAAVSTEPVVGDEAPATNPRFSLPAQGTLPEKSEVSKAEDKKDRAQKLPATPKGTSGDLAPNLRESTASKQNAGSAAANLSPAKSPASLNESSKANSAPESSSITSLGGSVSLSAAERVPLPTVLKTGQTAPHEVLLSNGLKVLILENHEFPVVSTLVWYKAGARDESKGATGVSHMVEHLMFQEVGSFKSGEIGTTIARLGGQFNGYTSDDFTTFFETLPSSRLELALKIESERMAHTRFTDENVKEEVANIRKEFENESKDAAAIISRDARAALFATHPYHNPTVGWKSDIEGLTAEHARDFYSKNFRPDNATLIISGDVHGKNALVLVHKYFGKIAGSGKPIQHNAIHEPPLKAEKRLNLKYAGNKEVAQIAYRAPAMDDADAPAMVVLERLLNGGLSGRLKSKLVDSKLCSYAQASFEIRKDPGLFTVTCTALPQTANAQSRIIESIDSLISQLKEKAPSESELKKARNQAEFAYYSECDGPYRAGFHLGYFDALDKWQNAYSWAEKLEAVSGQDIVRVAQKYFASDSRVVAWIAGGAGAKPASKQASSDAPEKEKEKDSPKPNPKPAENRRLTGFNHSLKPSTTLANNGQSRKDFLANSSRGFEHVQVVGFKESDEHESPKPNKKTTNKMNLPPVIRDIPGALTNAVTGNIPGTVNSVGSAIIGIPGAIGGIGSAVGTTASAIGKGIASIKGDSDERIVRRNLKNGVKLLVLQSHISPVVQIAGSIQAGDAYSPRARVGLSMLATSILNQGSGKRGKAQLTSLQDELGISANHMLKWQGGIETIDFSNRCLSRDLDTQLDLIGEVLASPQLDDSALEKAKAEASFLHKKNEESVSQKVERVLLQNLLDDNSPYCPADPSDKLKAISQASLQDLQKFYSSHVIPGAMTLVIVGDVDPNRVAEKVEIAFASWSGKSNHAEMHAKARSQRILRVSLPIKEAKKSSVCFGELLPISESQSEYGNLLIADAILVNHPMISRFEQALLRNASLEKAINGGEFKVTLDPLSNSTLWSIHLQIEPSASANAVKTIKSELKRFSQEGITAEELAEVKRYLLGSLPVKRQSTLDALADEIVESAEHGDTTLGFTSKINSVKNSSVESVNRLVKTVFRPEQSTIVVAGAGQSIKSMRAKESAATTDSSN